MQGAEVTCGRGNRAVVVTDRCCFLCVFLCVCVCGSVYMSIQMSVGLSGCLSDYLFVVSIYVSRVNLFYFITVFQLY